MELTIISRFQRLQASTKSLLHYFYSFSVLSPKACPYAMVLSFGGLFDEMGVLYVVEAGVEETDLGDYWQGEE